MKALCAYFKENYKEMLSLLFFLVCYASSILLFLGGTTQETMDWPSDLEFPAFLPCAIVCVVVIILFIFFENRFFKMKINVLLIVILSCLFVANLVVIILTPLENTFEYIHFNTSGIAVVSITNEWKIMYVFCYALLLLNIHISINYLLYRVCFNKQFRWLCEIIIVSGLIFVIYSCATEYEIYKLFFENIGETLKEYNPRSLTNNSNNYAAILLGAGFCSYSMFVVTKKHFFWILGLFFCINIVFPMSRICLALSIVLTIMIFAYGMIISWKKHAFRNINFIILMVFFITLTLLVCFATPEIDEYIKYVFLTNDSSIGYRIPLWKLAVSMTTGWHCFLGNGHGYFNTAFALITKKSVYPVLMPHNLYIQTYGALGFLGVAMLGCLIVSAIYKIIRLFKTNRDAALISIIGLVTILTFYLVEG